VPRYKPGSVVRLPPTTYVADLNPKVQAYLKNINHQRRTLHGLEVWVRYSEWRIGGPGRGHSSAVPVQAGPTRESVERKWRA
jgi:hypothetical protein